MKKIGKLSINPEKVIKNEELVNLRGGYGGYECDGHWAIACYRQGMILAGALILQPEGCIPSTTQNVCQEAYGGWIIDSECVCTSDM